MARRVKRKKKKPGKNTPAKHPVGQYFLLIAETVRDQAKLCNWSLPEMKRELYRRYLRFKAEGSYSTWNRAVRRAFGTGVRNLPDFRQIDFPWRN